jgi:hypothetical protein
VLYMYIHSCKQVHCMPSLLPICPAVHGVFGYSYRASCTRIALRRLYVMISIASPSICQYHHVVIRYGQ